MGGGGGARLIKAIPSIHHMVYYSESNIRCVISGVVALDKFFLTPEITFMDCQATLA